MESTASQPHLDAAEELLVQQLRSFAGVTAVSVKPVGKGVKLNDFGVRFKLF